MHDDRRLARPIAKVYDFAARDRRLDWRWQSPEMASELKAGAEIEPPKTQTQSKEQCYAAAA